MATTKIANKRASEAVKAAQRLLRARPRPLAIAAAVALLPWSGQLLALPTGETTLFGLIDYSRPNAQTMNINITTPSAGSSFNSFSINAGQTVNIKQLTSTSTYLIKDVGGMASQIYGTLNANGQVFMSNTSGFYFGRSAEVNVGALFATSLNINALDFEAGRYNFYKDGTAGTVVNEGRITASAYAALAGPQVRNDGVIVARAGSVALAAGDRVTLDMVGDGLIKVSVDQAALNASAINTGSIEADGGNVLLTARSANALLDTVVNNSGVIRANSLVERHGEIVLDGGSAGMVKNGGTLEASGRDAGLTGGTVKVLGDRIALFSSSLIDASGDAGGGTVLIGGNYQGNGLEANASRTYVEVGATINADAVTTGNGGKVIVWSEQQTVFDGAISVRGGSQSGNGGFVEVSGRDFLNFTGTADRRATNGRAGTLLLDPTDMTITGTTPVGTAVCLAGVCSDNLNPSTLSTTVLQTALATGDVNVNATAGSGTASSGGTINWTDGSVDANAHSLTLTGTTISFNGTLTNLNNLTFAANSGLVSGSGSATSSLGGSVSGIANTTFNIGGVSTGTAGGITFTGFAAADARTITGALGGFNDGTKTGSGMTFAAATNVTGAGTISNVTGAFNDATQISSATGVDYAGFNTVTGTGTTLNGVAGSFNDSAKTSAATGINYAGYAVNTVNGTGGNVTAVAGTFDVTSKISGASGISYGGFGVGTISGTGAGATITGSGLTYALTDATPNAGTSAGVTWTGFPNISDASGTVSMQTSGSVTGNVIAQTINYSSYGSPVTFSLSGASGTSTGIGGTRSNVVNVIGSGNSDVITGSGATYNLTGANQGNNGTVSWTSFENLSDSAAGTFNMHSGVDGSVSGSISALGGTLSYAGYATAVTVNLAGAAGSTTGIGGTWTGITTATGSGNSDTISGANQTYNLTGANQGNNSTVSWTSFENIADTGGTLREANATWTITGVNAGTVTNLSGSFSGIVNLQDTGTGTLKEANATWTISGANAGAVTNLSGSFSGMGSLQDTANTGTLKASNSVWTLNGSGTGTVTNLSGTFSGMANLTDLGAGTFTMHGTGNGSITGNLLSTNPGSISYAGYTSAATFEVSGAANQSTGIGGTWSGLNAATGSSNSDTIKGSNQTYTITGTNAGNSAGVSWTSFENITDTGTGTLRATNAIWTLNGPNAGTVTNLSGAFSGIGNLTDLGAGTFKMHGTGNGSVTGNLVSTNPGSISYAGYTSAVTFHVSGGANQSSGIGGTWTGLSTATGSSNSDTIKGTNQTYTITGANAGNSAGVSWTSFENITDTGTGTLRATNAVWTLNGANDGTVTNLSGAFSGIGNLTDLGAGTFNMHGTGNGSITGNVVSTNPGSISYAGYTSAATFELSGAANQSTGIGGTWSGLSTATGSSNSDTVKGTNRTYTVTGANVGNSGAVSWTSFENITDAGGGTLRQANANWTITGLNAGTVTNLSGSFSGMANLQDTGSGTLKEANATWTISGVNAGTVTNLSGSFSGMANLQDTANTGTLRSSGATWTLNSSNTGTVTNLSGTFSGMANLTDLAAGTFNMHGTGNGSITGNLVSTNPGSMRYAGYTSAATFELSGAANQSTGIGGTWTGLSSATGSSNSDTIKGTSRTYTITGANAGNSAGVSWTSFENITDTGNGTLRATNAIWTLNGPNAGTVTNLSGAFSGIGNLTDLGAGTFKMHGTGNGSVTGNLTSTNPGSISYAGYTSAATFELSGAANQSTGIGGTWSGLTTATGSSNADTVKGAGQTYTLDNAIANKAGNGTVTWTSFENLTDTAAATFNMGTAGSVSGSLSAVGGTVSYATRATPATFNLNGGASTGMGAWTGVTTVVGSTRSDTITGTGQTYTITAANTGNNGSVSWSAFENLSDLSIGTLQAANATWTLNGSNTGTVSNLSGSFAGMGNLTDLGSGTFNMHGTGNGSITGSLSGGANGSMNYAGYTTGVSVSLSGAPGSTTGVGGTRSGITTVSGSSHNDTITGAGATYNLTGTNAGNSAGLNWNSFENVSDATGGTFNLSVASNNVTGTLSSGGTTTLNSAVDITGLNLSVAGTLTMTGTASNWNLTGAPQPSLFQTTNADANVYFNGACIGGPACGTVIAIVGSIGSSVSQIAAQALKDAQSTDSVAKQIDYGFAGDVGTTPPMDHRIDETGISTPDCFEESRENQPCKAD